MPYVNVERDQMWLQCEMCEERVRRSDGQHLSEAGEEVFVCSDCIGEQEQQRALPMSVRIESTEEGTTRVFYRGEWIAEVILFSNSESYSWHLSGSEELHRGFAFKMAAIRAAVLSVLEADLAELKELS